MSNKKDQHYVPKFYLRRFSFINNQKEIGLFNTKTEFFRQQAPLKGQAYKPYLYGRDGELEDILSKLEGGFAKLIRNITINSELPTINSNEYEELLSFVVISILRNVMISNNLIQSFNNMGQAIYGDRNGYDEERKWFNIENEKAVIMSLSHVDKVLKYVKDLQIKLVKNKTALPFITSDNPVIRYNQLMEQRKWRFHNTTGLSSLGLQVLVPLDSQNLLILYDTWAYKIGDRKQKLIAINDVKDITQINILSFLNCSSNVFFNHEATEEYIKQLFAKSNQFEKANIVITQKYKDGLRPNSDLVTSTTTDIRTKLSLSFVKLNSQAKSHNFDNRMVQLRKHCYKLRQQDH